MAGNRVSSKQSSNQRTSVKRDDGVDYGAAFGSNLRRAYGGKKAKSKPTPAKPTPEEPTGAAQKQNAASVPTEKELQQQFGSKKQDGSFGLGDFSGLPSMAELKAEHVARLRSVREQTGVDFQLPDMEEALRSLTETSISKEDFVYMTQHLLSNTSKFTKHQVEVVAKSEDVDFAVPCGGTFESSNSMAPDRSTKSGIEKEAIFRDQPHWSSEQVKAMTKESDHETASCTPAPTFTNSRESWAKDFIPDANNPHEPSPDTTCKSTAFTETETPKFIWGDELRRQEDREPIILVNERKHHEHRVVIPVESGPENRNSTYIIAVPKLNRTMIDIYADELYSPSIQITSTAPASAQALMIRPLPNERPSAANGQLPNASHSQTPYMGIWFNSTKHLEGEDTSEGNRNKLARNSKKPIPRDPPKDAKWKNTTYGAHMRWQDTPVPSHPKSGSSNPKNREKFHLILQKTYSDVLPTRDGYKSQDPIVNTYLGKLRRAAVWSQELEDLEVCSEHWYERYDIVDFGDNLDWINLGFSALGSKVLERDRDRDGNEARALSHRGRRNKGQKILLHRPRIVFRRPWTWLKESELLSVAQINAQKSYTTKMNTHTEVYDNEENYPTSSEQRLRQWKTGAGRDKDWRQAPYVKVATKRRRFFLAQFRSDREKAPRAMRVVDSHFHSLLGAGIPILALVSQQKTFSKSLQPSIRYISPPLFLETGLKGSEKRHEAIITQHNHIPLAGFPRAGTSGHETLKFHGFPRDLVKFYHLQEEQRQPARKTSPSEQGNSLITLHYSGKIFALPLRLLRLMEHIKSEKQCEVFQLQDLNSGEEYETKVYDLRGLPKAKRDRRVKSLKHDTAAPSRLHTFHSNGKHFLVFPISRRNEGMPGPKIGTIGRRNSSGYEAAFPPLPGCKGHELPRPVKKSKTWAARFAANISVKSTRVSASQKPTPAVALVPRLLPALYVQTLNNELETPSLESAMSSNNEAVESVDYDKVSLEALNAFHLLNGILNAPELIGTNEIYNLCNDLKQISHAPYDDQVALQIIAGEIVRGNTAWPSRMFPQGLPLATRLMIRLHHHNPSWQKDVMNYYIKSASDARRKQRR